MRKSFLHQELSREKQDTSVIDNAKNIVRISMSSIFWWRWAVDLRRYWENNSAVLLIPPDLQANIHFLLSHWDKVVNAYSVFDCWAFVRYMYWVESFDEYEYNKISDVQNDIKSWDIIYFNQIYDRDNEGVPFHGWIHHYAIYIWWWLYLSKFWPSWSLEISDIWYIYEKFPYKYIWGLQKRVVDKS